MGRDNARGVKNNAFYTLGEAIQKDSLLEKLTMGQRRFWIVNST